MIETAYFMVGIFVAVSLSIRALNEFEIKKQISEVVQQVIQRRADSGGWAGVFWPGLSSSERPIDSEV